MTPTLPTPLKLRPTLCSSKEMFIQMHRLWADLSFVLCHQKRPAGV